MFVLGLKGPLSPEVVKRYANDLGGALFAPFQETETGNWAAPINDHFMDRAFSIANKHGLVVLGVRQSRGGGGGISYRNAIPEPELQVLGVRFPHRPSNAADDPNTGANEVSPLLENQQLSERAAAALERAASHLLPGEPLDTLRLFLALEGSDVGNQWERLWLETGDTSFLASLAYEDPDTAVDDTWSGKLFTGTCAQALATASQISKSYNLGRVSIGVMALGLIADPESAAARALTANGLGRSQLIELLQETTIGARLEGLDDILGSSPLARYRKKAHVIPASSTSDRDGNGEIMPDNGGLRHRIKGTIARSGTATWKPVTALCGRTWVPRDPELERNNLDDLPPCQKCQDEYDSMPDNLRTSSEINFSPRLSTWMMQRRGDSFETGY